MADLVEMVVAMAERLATLETRVQNMIVEGPVAQVDPARQMVRLRTGGTDEKPQLSAWVPYSQHAGAMKFHTPPSVGQPMTAFCKDGVPEKGLAFPGAWSDANPSPSDQGDEDVFTRGSLRLAFKGDGLTISVGGTSWHFSAEGLTQSGGQIEHDGHLIDKTHKHTQVEPGGGLSGPPPGGS